MGVHERKEITHQKNGLFDLPLFHDQQEHKKDILFQVTLSATHLY